MLQRCLSSGITWTALALAGLYGCDRLARHAALADFFRRPPPPPPANWPAVTLLEPITRGATALHEVLAARARLDYPAPVQRLLICDAADVESLAICRTHLASYPQPAARLVVVEAPAPVAGKIAKLQAALPLANSQLLGFVDDDVLLRPHSLQTLSAYLELPAAGAAFGLACYISWSTGWSSLMSLFVNANALPTYVAGCYLAEPFTITGHCFMLRRTVFEAAGGFAGMEERLDDDHELARRLRRLGLRSLQTPLVYDVANDLVSAHDYAGQLKRWFVLPRQTMVPFLNRREQLVTAVSGFGTLLPGMVALLALVARSRAALAALAGCLGLALASYLDCERYTRRRTPWRRLLLLPIGVLITPLQALWASLSDDTVSWRGQRLRVRLGGGFTIVNPEPENRHDGQDGQD